MQKTRLSPGDKIVVVWDTPIPENSSRTRYQRAKLLCSSFDCIILSGGNIPDSIANQAQSVHSFPFSRWLRFIFPIWATLSALYHAKNFTVVHSSPHSNSIISSYFIHFFTDTWVADLWDDPRLSFDIKATEPKKSTVDYFLLIYYFVNYHAVKILLNRCSVIVLALHPNILDDLNITSPRIIQTTNGGVESKTELPKNDMDESRFNIVYVGAIGPGRGVDKLVKATIQRSSNEVNLWLVGDYENGIVDCTHNSVNLTGEVDHAQALSFIRSADVCACPIQSTVRNYQYSYPIKIFEYISYDKPIVASKTPAISSILNDIENAYMVEAGNICEWVNAIDKIQEKENNRTNNSHCQNYSWENINKFILSQLMKSDQGCVDAK